MAGAYELVLYTDQLPTYADPIMDRLDPNRFALYRLYKDSTRYVNGRHVRDLSKLNRELGQVLLLTAQEDAYQLQPDNAIKVCSRQAPQALVVAVPRLQYDRTLPKSPRPSFHCFVVAFCTLITLLEMLLPLLLLQAVTPLRYQIFIPLSYVSA